MELGQKGIRAFTDNGGTSQLSGVGKRYCERALGRPVLGRGLLLAIALASLAVTSCKGDDAPPSCFDAIDYYYDAGCLYYNLESGEAIAANTIIAACQEIRMDGDDRCQGSVDGWVLCMEDVPSQSTTDADCNCSSELERVLSDC